MNLIYIVEPEDVPAYAPNFTIPGHSSERARATNVTAEVDRNGSVAAGMTGAPAAGAVMGVRLAAGALGGPLLGLPVSLLVSVAAASPSVARLFTKDKEPLPKELEGEERAEIDTFMRRHAYSLQMAKDAGFIFPPGHPQIGQVYKQHPLADMKNANKSDVYIPSEKYDELLLEEREAELLRLLVHLGATKVTISKKHNASVSKQFEGAVSGGSQSFGDAEFKASVASKTAINELDTREFELAGREWKEGDNLDRTRFAWVYFEPSWDALIEAREVGGCTKAALEVRENTSFSSDRSLALKVKSKIYGASI